jgi:hypothetical protein
MLYSTLSKIDTIMLTFARSGGHYTNIQLQVERYPKGKGLLFGRSRKLIIWQSAGGYTFTKLRAGKMNATYDRFFFADLTVHGKCFVILTETPGCSSDLLMLHGQNTVGIGDIFAIIEPDQVL